MTRVFLSLDVGEGVTYTVIIGELRHVSLVQSSLIKKDFLINITRQHTNIMHIARSSMSSEPTHSGPLLFHFSAFCNTNRHYARRLLDKVMRTLPLPYIEIFCISPVNIYENFVFMCPRLNNTLRT